MTAIHYAHKKEKLKTAYQKPGLNFSELLSDEKAMFNTVYSKAQY